MNTYEYTPTEVSAKILAAHAAGTLTAQIHSGSRAAYYVNEDDRVYRCAVGQLLSEEDAEALEAGDAAYMYADTLVSQSVITGVDGDALRNIQRLHDDWAAHVGGAEERFLAAVREFGQ